MRTMRTLLAAAAFVLAAVIFFTTFSSTPPSSSTALHSLVTQTHQQLNNLQKIKEEFEGDQPLDKSLLTKLDFVDFPFIYPNHSWSNITTPTIVTAVSSYTLHLVSDIKSTALQVASNSTFVVFALDLALTEMETLEKECNDSCEVFVFDFTAFPSHVRDLRLNAFRPIIIQIMLVRAGAVLWLDPCLRLREGRHTGTPSVFQSGVLQHWLTQTKAAKGLLTWPLNSPMPSRPTSALTHPDMFPAFHVRRNEFDFQSMGDPKAVLLINTGFVHRKVVRKWVHCALTQSCISPVGAQDTGCRFDKKPIFRYSGCHLYDTSAFNVALGLAFGFEFLPYLLPELAFECSLDHHKTPSPVWGENNPFPALTLPKGASYLSHNLATKELSGRKTSAKAKIRRRSILGGGELKYMKKNRGNSKNESLLVKSKMDFPEFTNHVS